MGGRIRSYGDRCLECADTVGVCKLRHNLSQEGNETRSDTLKPKQYGYEAGVRQNPSQNMATLPVNMAVCSGQEVVCWEQCLAALAKARKLGEAKVAISGVRGVVGVWIVCGEVKPAAGRGTE